MTTPVSNRAKFGVLRFESEGGRMFRDGKVHYPHMLRLSLDRHQISTVLRFVASQVEQVASEPIELVLFGKLTRDAEEDNGQEIEYE